MTSHNIAQCRAVIDAALGEYLEVIPPVEVRFANMTGRSKGTALGITTYRWQYLEGIDRPIPAAMTITLNTRFWKHLPAEQQRITLRHEAMHVACAWLHGRAIDIAGHGPLWENAMRAIGDEPMVYTTQETLSLCRNVMMRKAPIGVCDCRGHILAPAQARLLRALRLMCINCGQKIMPAERSR